MKFTPRSEKEAVEARLLKVGEGNYEIIKAEEKSSKSSGQPMFAITLKVWDSDGKQGLINDFIVMTSDWDWKLRHLAYSCGLEKEYENGEIHDTQLVNRCGKLKIGYAKDKTGKYPDKNSVFDYLPARPETKAVSTAAIAADELSDDVPF